MKIRIIFSLKKFSRNILCLDKAIKIDQCRSSLCLSFSGLCGNKFHSTDLPSQKNSLQIINIASKKLFNDTIKKSKAQCRFRNVKCTDPSSNINTCRQSTLPEKESVTSALYWHVFRFTPEKRPVNLSVICVVHVIFMTPLLFFTVQINLFFSYHGNLKQYIAKEFLLVWIVFAWPLFLRFIMFPQKKK